MSSIEKYRQDASSGILALREIKADLHSQLSSIKVKVDPSNGLLMKAIEEVFGKQSEDDPNKGYITFDMYMQCLNLIRLAGKAKAKSILGQ